MAKFDPETDQPPSNVSRRIWLIDIVVCFVNEGIVVFCDETEAFDIVRVRVNRPFDNLVGNRLEFCLVGGGRVAIRCHTDGVHRAVLLVCKAVGGLELYLEAFE